MYIAFQKIHKVVMSENRQWSENKPDELDLLSLFDKVSAFFINYFRLIASCSLIGMALGFTLYKVVAKEYKSSALLHSFTLTNTEQINIIENWDDLLKNKEYNILGKLLNCSPSLLNKVTEIKAEEIQRLYSENNPNGFEVEVLVTDNAVLDSLQHGIIYGLESSDYMKERLATKRSAYSQLIEKTKAEIEKLDSTKTNIGSIINNNMQHSPSYILDISGINTQMIALNEKLMLFKEQLKFTGAVQVLHKFEKFKTPEKPKLIKSLALGFILGFATGYITAMFLAIKKKLSQRRRNEVK